MLPLLKPWPPPTEKNDSINIFLVRPCCVVLPTNIYLETIFCGTGPKIVFANFGQIFLDNLPTVLIVVNSLFVIALFDLFAQLSCFGQPHVPFPHSLFPRFNEFNWIPTRQQQRFVRGVAAKIFGRFERAASHFSFLSGLGGLGGSGLQKFEEFLWK
jgi:hypothetical protein